MDAQPTESHDPRDNVGNADSMIEYEYKDHELPVPMTDRERLELGQDIAAAQSIAEQAEKDKKAADESFKGTIEAAYANVSEIAGKLRFGKLLKMVNCRLGEIRILRMDDGAELSRRAMTEAERQMGMQFGDEAKAG